MTGDEERRDTEPELEDFVRENLDVLERIIRKEKKAAEESFRRNKDKVRDRVDQTRKDAKSAAKQTFEAITNPEVHSHFMNAGLEFISGINSLVRSMPRPDFMKDEEYDEYDDGYKDERHQKQSERQTPESIKIRTPEDEEESEPTQKNKSSAKKDKE